MAHLAIVTGASRGIGSAVSVALATLGYDLLLVARSESGLKRVAEECASSRVKIFATDITNPDSVGHVAAAVGETGDRVWGLVNNAGMAESAPLARTDDELIRRHLELNYIAPMRLMRSIAPLMAQHGGGRVINLLSTAALTGYPYVSAYAASKHALLGATRSLAREFAGKGVTFNAVCPGYVRTEMFAQTVANIAQKTGLDAAAAEAKLAALSPQQRVFEPSEVANVVAFLLSEAAHGINGQALSVDGGEIAH